jgi:folate-dependent phosphoribosylglycinamide formyltransferase PurN
MNWIAFFSQTGSEIVNISKSLGIKPTLVVTNNTTEEKWKYHPELRKLDVTILQAQHDTIVRYFEAQTIYNPDDTIITLHGYLRIIPANICTQYKMYNGHPANIRLYPELKGKDPQIRTWNNRRKYPIIGSVIHEVTPGVDEGEIVREFSTSNSCRTLDEMYDTLKQTSLRTWEYFLKEILNEDSNNRSSISR